jgi:hypothetical protein
MIDVKKAVTAALTYAQELGRSGATLEEVDRSEDDRYWLVTLGFPRRLNDFAVLGGVKYEPDYKVFKVDAETGEVLSMKIRAAA